VIQALEIATLVATGLLALFGIGMTLANRPPDHVLRIAVGAVVALLVVQGVIAAVRVLGGVSLPENSTFLIYLAVSVCVLPIALQFATARDPAAADPTEHEPAGTEPAESTPAEPQPGGPTRWGSLVIAVAAIATGVAVLRLQGLWDAGFPGG
jgi:hypothetical protein